MMKKLIFYGIFLILSVEIVIAKKFPPVFCLETVAGTHNNRPVWLIWKTTQCTPRVDNPQFGKRKLISIEKFVQLNMVDDKNNIVLIYPR